MLNLSSNFQKFTVHKKSTVRNQISNCGRFYYALINVFSFLCSQILIATLLVILFLILKCRTNESSE